MKKNSKDTKLSWNDYEIVDKNTGVIGILKNTTLLIREEGYGMIMNSRLYYIVDIHHNSYHMYHTMNNMFHTP